MNLTPRQLEVLKFIAQFRQDHGYAPTMAEIAEEFDVSSVTIYEHIVALEKKGAIKRTRNRARSVEIVSDIPGEEPKAPSPEDYRGKLPLLGYIAAGRPFEAVEDSEEIDVSAVLGATGETFVLQVRGDSMTGVHIEDGDYVICRRQPNVRNGDTVVALLDGGEATLKRFYREGGRIRLQPENPMYPAIYVDNVDVQGVVVGVLRRY